MTSTKEIISFIRPQILAMQGYTPGLQKNDSGIIKLNSNENPFPVTKDVIAAIHNTLQNEPIEKYPDPRSLKLRKAIAKKHNVNENMVMIGNGSDEILSILFRSILKGGDSILIPDPTYSLYPVLTDIIGAHVARAPVKPDWYIDFQKMSEMISQNNYRLSVFANPNAPTGLVEKQKDVINFVKNSKIPVLVDEAYVDFGSKSLAAFVGTPECKMLMTCGTFSKSYSLAGLRVGWLIAEKKVILELDKIRDSYNVNRISQTAACAALQNDQEFKNRIAQIIKTREEFRLELEKLGFSCLKSSGNFIFCKTPFQTATMALSLKNYFRENKILIRHFNEPGLDQFLRISIGQEDQMRLLVTLCKKWIHENK